MEKWFNVVLGEQMEDGTYEVKLTQRMWYDEHTVLIHARDALVNLGVVDVKKLDDFLRAHGVTDGEGGVAPGSVLGILADAKGEGVLLDAVNAEVIVEYMRFLSEVAIPNTIKSYYAEKSRNETEEDSPDDKPVVQ